MKKFYLIALILFIINTGFAQFTRITSLPASRIFTFKVNNNVIYCSGSNIVYKSIDGGLGWSSMVIGPDTIQISKIIFYNNKMFVGTFNAGVFFSSDNGISWQNNGTNFGQVSDFAIHNNILYATTFGEGVFVLNAATNHWSPFNNLLPSYSIVVQQIISSPNFLIIAAGANGTFYRYDFNINGWNEEYYDGILHPGLLINNLIDNGDTLFAMNFRRIIRSNNAGLTWTNDNNGIHAGNGSHMNIFAGINNYYTSTYVPFTVVSAEGTWIQQRSKQAVAGTTWATNEEFLPDAFAYDLIEFNNKLFLATEGGLFVKNLDPIILPVSFILFNANCKGDKVVLNWVTAQEQNSSRFDIESSTDGFHWTVIGSKTAAGNSSTEKNYSFTDNGLEQNNYCRIAEYDLDKKMQYSPVVQASCNRGDVLSLSPNPTRGVASINITTQTRSKILMQLFDSKGALVKTQRGNLLQGNNQLSVDITSLINGVYYLQAEWNNGQGQKPMQVIKQ
ncbi:MAG: T9SS type A sorting domain-containing protein [Ginsengibacter sp.]